MAATKHFHLALIFILLCRLLPRCQRIDASRHKPKFWVCPIFAKREILGEFHCLVIEMMTSNREKVCYEILIVRFRVYSNPGNGLRLFPLYDVILGVKIRKFSFIAFVVYCLGGSDIRKLGLYFHPVH